MNEREVPGEEGWRRVVSVFANDTPPPSPPRTPQYFLHVEEFSQEVPSCPGAMTLEQTFRVASRLRRLDEEYLVQAYQDFARRRSRHPASWNQYRQWEEALKSAEKAQWFDRLSDQTKLGVQAVEDLLQYIVSVEEKFRTERERVRKEIQDERDKTSPQWRECFDLGAQVATFHERQFDDTGSRLQAWRRLNDDLDAEVESEADDRTFDVLNRLVELVGSSHELKIDEARVARAADDMKRWYSCLIPPHLVWEGPALYQDHLQRWAGKHLSERVEFWLHSVGVLYTVSKDDSPDWLPRIIAAIKDTPRRFST